MWFDLVLIDRVFSDGSMASHHIRSKAGEPFPIDRLEDIDPSVRAVDVVDKGPVRIYNRTEVTTTILNSKLKNFVFSREQIMLQLEHIGVPVSSGYYAILLPKGWRTKEINIYDPYHNSENVAEKRSYRDTNLLWDRAKQISCAQFNMRSERRGTFSIGIIASLVPASSQELWTDRDGVLELIFSDERHEGHRSAPGYAAESRRVFEAHNQHPIAMPGINVSATLVPSMNIVDWGRYIRDRIRRVSR